MLNNYFYNRFNHNFPALQNSDFAGKFESLNNVNCPEELLCTEDVIFDLLVNLDTTRSVGSDGISAKMLKCTAASISSPLTSLCNLSISTGVFPSAWKQARIVPVPKGTNKTLPSGYRPISILPVVSKIIERHIIVEHLEHSAPISPKQWGFISFKSTISALIKVVDDWSRALDQEFEVCIVFFNISKAFDTVPHLPLLQQMEKLNLNPFLLRWIESYLRGRTQHIVVDGCQSQVLPVISGVPRGSVLGSLLFICYINDVASVASEGSDMSLFADDIALYRVIKTPADYVALQDDVNSVSTVISSKYLHFNKTKCRTMLLSRKRTKSCPPPSLLLDGTILTQVSNYKYLGITITSDLSWSLHISCICNKARRLVEMLYRHFYKNSNSHTLLKLYLAYVRLHLEYCSYVWSPSLKGDIDIVETVQKYALRVCTKSWDLSYDDLLNATSVSPLHQRRIIACLCHLYKILNGLTEFPNAPVQSKNFPYNSRLGSSSYLNVPKFRTFSHGHSFSEHHNFME